MFAKSFVKSIYRVFLPNTGQYIKKELVGCQSVLDLGCGHNSSIQYFNIPFSVGVDLFDRYLEESKNKNIHNQYVKEDVRKVEFSSRSFDGIILIDVLEHLKKEEGLELIEKMNKWARKKIVILTPNGFIEQEAVDNNSLQEHRSGWRIEEFEKLGFKVHGINGLKHLRGHMAILKYKPLFLWMIISDITQRMVYRAPKFAFHLLAVKEIK
jgi:hypothetical protein